MTLKPFINYYGGKYRCALMYPNPQFDVIIEPFAGAAGYALRHHTKKVKLYEKYDVLVEMWRFLIEASEDDIMSLPLVFEDLDNENIPIGAKTLIGFLLNTGSARPCKTKSKWAKQNLKSSQFWGEKRRERIASQVSKIKHWEIHKIASFEEIPNEQATWFIDPPYQKQGIHYVHNSNDISFEILSQWCLSRKGEIIVCEQEQADWLPWNNRKTIKGNNYTKKSNEVWYHAEQR